MKLSSVRYLVHQGFDNVWKNRVMAFASFCVLLVSLLLVGISVLFYININEIIGGIEDKNEVIVFITDETSDPDIETLGEKLRNLDNVKEVSLYTAEEAFEDLKAQNEENAAVFESIGDGSFLPDAYRISVSDISKMDTTLKEIENFENVDSLRAPDDFVELLTELRRIVTIVAGAIIIAMLIVSMVIISNTTRASVFSRRREISIMQSVGATRSFIRFPFFIEGMINGFLAGVFATLLTWFSYDKLVQLLGRYNMVKTIGMGKIIPYDSIAIPVTLIYIISGALIGAVGSVISTRAHLKYRAANM